MVDGGVCGRKKVCIKVTELRRLGVDEIALRKGHEDRVVVMRDLKAVAPKLALVHQAKETFRRAFDVKTSSQSSRD